MADNLILEVLDYNWNPLVLSNNVVEATITDELGSVGEAEVNLPIDDPAIFYIPDPSSPLANEVRWRLYEDNAIVFAGVVDSTTKRVSSDNTFTFGGKQRGILLGNSNVGRRDFTAWNLQDLTEELLRDNVAKAPIASIQATSSYHELHPPINAITGDAVENNYWATAISGTNHTFTVNLGDQTDIVGIRVVPPWWDQRWYNFDTHTSVDNAAFISRGSYSSSLPLTDKGKFYPLSGVTAKYVRITITSSSDQIGRLACVYVYRKLADVGTDTDYVVSWVENDDSGNVYPLGNYLRLSENGAFAGDGVLGNSLITRLSGSASITHVFRGTAAAPVFTQGDDGGTATADIYLDNEFKQTVTVSGGTYQTKPYEVVGLTNGIHHLKVVQNTGTPQLDYFVGLYETSYRPIRDDDASIAYNGSWEQNDGESFSNYSIQRSNVSGSNFIFDFKGDKISYIGTKGPRYGYVEIYMDGALQTTLNNYNSVNQFQQTLYTWSGSYGAHTLRGKVLGQLGNPAGTGTYIDVDHLKGSFAHIIYLRSFYETNLRLLDRVSEITNGYLRYNHDGTVDLLGQVGDWSQTVIREGENEGGSIITASAENDYSETASAILALVSGPDNLPIKAFVIDREAVKRMGLKIRKSEMSDANDAYLLARQARVELQEHVEPQKKYNIDYDPSDVGDIAVGQTTVLHSARLGLTGNQQFRVGRKVTTYSKE